MKMALCQRCYEHISDEAGKAPTTRADRLAAYFLLTIGGIWLFLAFLGGWVVYDWFHKGVFPL